MNTRTDLDNLLGGCLLGVIGAFAGAGVPFAGLMEATKRVVTNPDFWEAINDVATNPTYGEIVAPPDAEPST